MSARRSLQIPDGVRPCRLGTSRGAFAAFEATPARGPSGRAGSAALLLPGWTGSKEDFLTVLAPLAGTGRRVVAVDQRGQYETPGPDDPAAYTLAALGSDAAALARALDAGPVHLLGHSFGGLVARAAVLADPTAFASLTLLCSGPAGFDSSQADLLRMMVAAIPAHGLAAVYAAKRELERANGLPDVTPEVEAFLERRFCANSPASLAAITQHLVDAPDRVDDLAAVPLPKLVAYGVDDDGWAADIQQGMAKRLGARLEVIPGAGHSVAMDQPAGTVRMLTDFWNAADAAQTSYAAGYRAP